MQPTMNNPTPSNIKPKDDTAPPQTPPPQTPKPTDQDKAPSKLPTSLSAYSIRRGSATGVDQKHDHDFDNDARFITTYMVVPPDGGWGWVVVVAAFLCFLVSEGVVVNFNLVYLEVLCKEFDANIPEVVLIMSLLRSSNLIFGPFSSALINRYGFRRIAILGGIISSFSFGICYFATSITYLCIFYGVCAGIGNGMVFMASTLCLSFYFQRWRPLAVCLASCGSNVGGAVMGIVLSHIRDAYGWRMSMVYTSVSLALCSFLGLFFRPIKPIKITREVDQNVSNLIDLTARGESRWRTLGNNYPTSSRFMSKTSVYSKQFLPSMMSMKTLVMSDTGNQASTTMDLLEPMYMSNTGGSDMSIRIVVGQERVTGYWIQHVRKEYETLKKVFCCGGRESDIGSRPLYRDDIFYEGLLDHRHLGFIGLNLAMTRVTTKDDIDEEKSARCMCCPVAVRRTLSTMLDFSLFKSPSFVLVLVNSCLVFFAAITPYAYMPKRSIENGMELSTVNLLIPSISMAGLVGKLITACISSLFPKIDLVIYCNVISTLCSVAVIAIGSTRDVATQFCASMLFGVSQSTYISLRSLIAVQLLGLERLTNAFGLMQLFSGLASIAGPPFLGWIQEVTSSFDVVFWVAGAILLLGAFVLYPATFVNKLEKRKASRGF